jgi:CheY-like chemotaxis protein
MGNVLVVDNETGIRDLLREILVEEGHQVVTARDGVEALEVLEGAERFLVLLDLMMPRLDGSGVIQALEGQGAAGRRHPVIVMSAAERLFAFSAAFHSELVRGRLVKPFDVETLLALVDEHAPPSGEPEGAARDGYQEREDIERPGGDASSDLGDEPGAP